MIKVAGIQMAIKIDNYSKTVAYTKNKIKAMI